MREGQGQKKKLRVHVPRSYANQLVRGEDDDDEKITQGNERTQKRVIESPLAINFLFSLSSVALIRFRLKVRRN